MKLDVVLISIGIPHDGRTLSEQSLGGSETAAIHVSRALAKRGHNVTVFSPCPERGGSAKTRGGIMDDVSWRHIDTFAAYLQAVPHDVLVVSRDLNIVRAPAQTKVRVLWCHDLALKRFRGVMSSAMWNTDACYVLSRFQQAQYRETYGLPDDRLVVTRNGVDVAAIRAATKGVTRDRNKIVYGSRPERGLETALRVMDILAQRGSKLRLEVSWYDHAGLAPELQNYYAGLRAEAERRPNVKLCGALTQAAWHRQIASARALIEPGCVGAFRHISCIVAMEAQACGTPVVAAAKGAVPDTLGGAGIVVGDEATDIGSAVYAEVFANALLEATRPDGPWDAFHAQAEANTPNLDWGGVAEQWETHWLELLRSRTSDPWRMERHFARMGEHEAGA